MDEFEEGYRMAKSSEREIGKGIRFVEGGTWGMGVVCADATYMSGGQKKKQHLGWLGAGELADMIIEGEAEDVEIRNFDRGKLYASIERTKDVIIHNQRQPATKQRHPQEMVAGLYLLGRLDGMETPEIAEIVEKVPDLQERLEKAVEKYTSR